MTKTTIRKLAVAALCAILATALAAGCDGRKNDKQTNAAAPTKLVLIAPLVKNPPSVDGDLSDTAWQKATPLTVSTAGGPRMTIRAVRTGEKLYIQSLWSDKTKNDMDTPWRFSAGSWTKGPSDDVFILVWNINDSIPGFNKQGGLIIKQNPRPFARVRGFTIELPNYKKKKSQPLPSGDIWDLALGLTNPLKLANDMYLSPIKKANDKSEKELLVLATQSDAFIYGSPWTKNVTVGSDGQERPIYRFKDGRTVENTPFPTISDMVPITETDVFQEGQTVPYYLFEKGKSWGGSMDDVAAKGVYKDGIWMAEFARNLNTKNKDDINFLLKPGRNYYVFSAMIRDADSDYYPSPPISLELDGDSDVEN